MENKEIRLSDEDLKEIAKMTGQRTPWIGDMKPHLGQSRAKWETGKSDYKEVRKSLQ
jgi:hypothetical protein